MLSQIIIIDLECEMGQFRLMFHIFKSEMNLAEKYLVEKQQI
jgi:hypothetical protein